MLVNPINSVVSYHHQHNHYHHHQPNDPVSSLHQISSRHLSRLDYLVYSYVACFGQVNLAESIPLQIKPQYVDTLQLKGLVTQTRGSLILSWKISPLAVGSRSTPTVLRCYAMLGACINMIPSCARQPLALQEWFHIKIFFYT